MTLGFDQKEDLRLRMMELEKKLAESEEERSKLEKTCNILMRAFREEEKMRYKALNKKYEKFLEDCSQRRRRNDIILKSLCRIEDRARALFAKTERLKILKDRYISYLKISDIKQNEPALALKNFPYSSQSQKIIHDVTSKSVHWKSPYISDVILSRNAKEFVEPEGSSFANHGLNYGIRARENKEDSFEDIFTPRRSLEFKKLEKGAITYQNIRPKAPSEDRNNAFESKENSEGALENYKPPKSQAKLEKTSLNRENNWDNINHIPVAQNTNLTNDLVYPVITDREPSYSRFLSNELEEKKIDDVAAIREKVAFTHQESIEKLKKVLSAEDDEVENDKEFKSTGESQKIIEKDEIEMNEKNNLKTNYEDLNRVVISKADMGSYNELKSDAIDLQPDHFEESAEGLVRENFPVGLDGVDYQNETYPESYYEQPVHHNHTSIASDVILEEDESEQDFDQNISEKEAKNFSIPGLESENESSLSKNNNQETNQPNDPYPEKQLINSLEKENNLHDESLKCKSQEEQFKMDSTGFGRDDQSTKSDSTLKSEKSNKRGPQSNLMHLLESDSESFQIEHGDLAIGNDDSDFDFSFNQN